MPVDKLENNTSIFAVTLTPSIVSVPVGKLVSTGSYRLICVIPAPDPLYGVVPIAKSRPSQRYISVLFSLSPTGAVIGTALVFAITIDGVVGAFLLITTYAL